MPTLVDQRPSFFFVSHGFGSLFAYFDTPHEVERTLRFSLENGDGCINVMVGRSRTPVAMHILNAWRVGTGPTEFDLYDHQLKWELYERAVVLIQFGGGCDSVRDILHDTVDVARRWIQGRFTGRNLQLVG